MLIQCFCDLPPPTHTLSLDHNLLNCRCFCSVNQTGGRGSKEGNVFTPKSVSYHTHTSCTQSKSPTILTASFWFKKIYINTMAETLYIYPSLLPCSLSCRCMLNNKHHSRLSTKMFNKYWGSCHWMFYIWNQHISSLHAALVPTLTTYNIC